VTTLGHVAIVGAGQVGTMLGTALRSGGAAAGVALFDTDPDALESSLARGAGDVALESADHAVDADVVVLATPIPEIVRLIETFGPRARPGSLLLDTGSAKRVVVRAMRSSVPPGVHAVGGHPMAGTETRGPAGARPEALSGATFVLCPIGDDEAAIAAGRSFVEAVGARPFVMDADEHDRIVAVTSHVPHLLAFALAALAGRVGEARPTADLASTGFRSATRLAASDPSTTAAFLSANADLVLEALDGFGTAMDELVARLDDAEALGDLLAAGGAARARLIAER
jgi:prephenate dehydrogenase